MTGGKQTKTEKRVYLQLSFCWFKETPFPVFPRFIIYYYYSVLCINYKPKIPRRHRTIFFERGKTIYHQAINKKKTFYVFQFSLYDWTADFPIRIPKMDYSIQVLSVSRVFEKCLRYHGTPKLTMFSKYTLLSFSDRYYSNLSFTKTFGKKRLFLCKVMDEKRLVAFISSNHVLTVICQQR